MTTTTDSGWSDYWDQDVGAGEVFVNAEGERHPALAAYWRGVFATLPSGSKVVDLASGAGSIYAHLPEAHGYELIQAYRKADKINLYFRPKPAVSPPAPPPAAGREPTGSWSSSPRR